MSENKEKFGGETHKSTLDSLQAKLAELRQPFEAKTAMIEQTRKSILEDAVVMVEGNEELAQNNRFSGEVAPAHADQLDSLSKDMSEQMTRLDAKNQATRDKLKAIESEFESLKSTEGIDISPETAEQIEAEILEITDSLKSDETQRANLHQLKSAELAQLRRKYKEVAEQGKDNTDKPVEFAVQTLIEMHKNQNPDFEVNEEDLIDEVKKMIQQRKDEKWGEKMLTERTAELASLKEIYSKSQAEFKEIKDLIDERIGDIVQANDREIFLNPYVIKTVESLQKEIEKDLNAWLNKKERVANAKSLVEALMAKRDDYRDRLQALESKILEFIRKHDWHYNRNDSGLSEVIHNDMDRYVNKYGTAEIIRDLSEVSDQSVALKHQAEIFMRHVNTYAAELRKKVGTAYDELNKVISRGKLSEYAAKLRKMGVEINIRS